MCERACENHDREGWKQRKHVKMTHSQRMYLDPQVLESLENIYLWGKNVKKTWNQLSYGVVEKEKRLIIIIIIGGGRCKILFIFKTEEKDQNKTIRKIKWRGCKRKQIG